MSRAFGEAATAAAQGGVTGQHRRHAPRQRHRRAGPDVLARRLRGQGSPSGCLDRRIQSSPFRASSAHTGRSGACVPMSRLPRGVRQRRDEPRLPARGTLRMLAADPVAFGAPHGAVDVLCAVEGRPDTRTAERLAAMLTEESDNGIDEWEAGAVHRAYRRADITAAAGDLDVKSFPEARDHHRHFGRRDTSLDFNAIRTEARSAGKKSRQQARRIGSSGNRFCGWWRRTPVRSMASRLILTHKTQGRSTTSATSAQRARVSAVRTV